MILLIDDDKEILMSVGKFLSGHGFKIITSTDGDDALKILIEKSDQVNLVIMDMMMPVTNGIELCQFIRKSEHFLKIPILMLTSLSEISHKYNAFDVGADDYLTKPFELLELLMRVKSLLKRSNYIPLTYNNSENKAIDNPLFQEGKSIITINGNEIYLTSLEYSILKYLYDNSDRYVSTNELLEKILGHKKGDGNPDAIRTHIKNLRTKIEDEPSNPKTIMSIPRRGYIYSAKKM